MSAPPKRISAEAWAYGQWNVAYWAEVYLGVKLHPGQVKFTEAYLRRTQSGWRALNLWICVSAGNRAGKTLALAIIVMHACAYKMGMPPGKTPAEQAHRLEVPYEHWHFAVEQGPAEQMFTEIALLMGGTHPAQKEGCPWVLHVGGGDRDHGVSLIMSITDTGLGSWCKGSKERGEYAYIKFSHDLGGAAIHFRSTKAKALSAIGQNMHGLSFDEAGLQEAPTLTYLLEDVMHARRLGTGGQFIVISTPSIATSTEFQDLWYKGDPDDPFHEDRRFSMRMSSRLNVGYGLDEESFIALTVNQPESWIKQNIEGEFVQATQAWFSKHSVDARFDAALPVEQEAKEGQLFLHSLDPGLKDKCWSLVFRVNPGGRSITGVSIERQIGKQTTRGIVELGARQHKRFALGGRADVLTAVDNTALGGHMFSELLEEQIGTSRKIEFGGNVKAKRSMLSDLRLMFDEGRITMPAGGLWGEAQHQLNNYKLLDRKIEQDIVMGLAMIAKLLRSVPPDAPVGEPVMPFTYGPDPQRTAQKNDHVIDGENIRRAMLARARQSDG